VRSGAANAFAAGLSTTTIDIRLERRDAGIYQRSVGVAIDAPAELDVHELSMNRRLKERVQVAHCLGIVETHACRGVLDPEAVERDTSIGFSLLQRQREHCNPTILIRPSCRCA